MKLDQHHFEEIAKMLPRSRTHFLNPRLVTGAEILSWNTIKKINGIDIEPGQMYWYQEPVFHEHNHAKKILKLFKSGGMKACNFYIEKCIRDANEMQFANKNIGIFKLITEKIKHDINNGKN